MESFQPAPILFSNAQPWTKCEEASLNTQSFEACVQSQPGRHYLDDSDDGSKNLALYSGLGSPYSQRICNHFYKYDWLSPNVSSQTLQRQPRRKSERPSDYGLDGGAASTGMEEHKAEQRARLLASRFALCEGYVRYRNRQPDQEEKRGKVGQKWPDHIEDVFLRALCRWEPCGRRKIIPPGGTKLMGRNELIADYILAHTGESRTRKQVSSHLQVIKPFVKNEAMIMRYLATPPARGAAKSKLARKARCSYNPDGPPEKDDSDQCSSQESAYAGIVETYCGGEDDMRAYGSSLASPIDLPNNTGTNYDTSWINKGSLPSSVAALTDGLAISPFHTPQTFDFLGGNIAVTFGNAGGLEMDLETDPALLAPQSTGVHDYADLFPPGLGSAGQSGFPVLDGVTDDFETGFQLQACGGADAGTREMQMPGGRVDAGDEANVYALGEEQFGFRHDGRGLGAEGDARVHPQPQDPFGFEQPSYPFVPSRRQDEELEQQQHPQIPPFPLAQSSTTHDQPREAFLAPSPAQQDTQQRLAGFAPPQRNPPALQPDQKPRVGSLDDLRHLTGGYGDGFGHADVSVGSRGGERRGRCVDCGRSRYCACSTV